MGRIQVGLSLAKASWKVLVGDPKLFVLPIISAIASLTVMLAIAIPTFLLVRSQDSETLVYPAIAIGFYALTFVATYFGVAFAAVVARRLDGQPASLDDGFTAANARLGAIGWWTFIAGTVGLLIRAFRELPGVGGLAEAAISAVAGFVWGAATFFAIPILATEQVSAKEAIGRSATILKQRWGEGAAGFVSITAVLFLVTLPVIILFVIVAMAAANSAPAVIGLAVVMLVIAILAISLAQTALQQVFRVVLLRHATGKPLPAVFDAQALDAAVRPRRGLFGRR